MRRILWIAISCVVAVVLVTAAYQANTNTRGSSASGYHQQQVPSGGDNRYKDLRLKN